MDEKEFDKFAEQYRSICAAATRTSGEEPEFFAEYKVKDVVVLAQEKGYPADLRLLDFGAGVGNSLPHFRKEFPTARITCLDVSLKSLAEAIAGGRFRGDRSSLSAFFPRMAPCLAATGTLSYPSSPGCSVLCVRS